MRRVAGILVAGVMLAAAGSAAAAPTTLLHLRGIGPLQLGMTRAAALATGWLGGRHGGCPLGGPPLPIDYALTGRRAPAGIRGTAEFAGERLRVLSFSGGVRTAAGVVVGRTTAAAMTSRYRTAGLTAAARFDSTFGGSFVTVTRKGQPTIGGFAATRGPISLLAIPSVPVCE